MMCSELLRTPAPAAVDLMETLGGVLGVVRELRALSRWCGSHDFNPSR